MAESTQAVCDFSAADFSVATRWLLILAGATRNGRRARDADLSKLQVAAGLRANRRLSFGRPPLRGACGLALAVSLGRAPCHCQGGRRPAAIGPGIGPLHNLNMKGTLPEEAGGGGSDWPRCPSAGSGPWAA
jgi:hypothetical protein